MHNESNPYQGFSDKNILHIAVSKDTNNGPIVVRIQICSTVLQGYNLRKV